MGQKWISGLTIPLSEWLNKPSPTHPTATIHNCNLKSIISLLNKIGPNDAPNKCLQWFICLQIALSQVEEGAQYKLIDGIFIDCWSDSSCLHGTSDAWSFILYATFHEALTTTTVQTIYKSDNLMRVFHKYIYFVITDEVAPISPESKGEDRQSKSFKQFQW